MKQLNHNSKPKKITTVNKKLTTLQEGPKVTSPKIKTHFKVLVGNIQFHIRKKHQKK